MKKNAMLKIAAILMVAVLLTTCAISSTFAKYTTNGSYADNARVAKFGVTVTAGLEDLFAAEYKDGQQNDVDGAYDITVDGSTTSINDKLVAPGTKKSITSAITVSGTPEVAVSVSTTAVLTLENWKDANGDDYCPLVFTVGDKTFKIGTDGISDVAGLKAAVEGAIAEYKNEYAPNTDLSKEATSTIVIGWEWAYENVVDGVDKNATNDTFLGDEAAAGKAATVALSLTQTVEQLDKYPSGN